MRNFIKEFQFPLIRFRAVYRPVESIKITYSKLTQLTSEQSNDFFRMTLMLEDVKRQPLPRTDTPQQAQPYKLLERKTGKEKALAGSMCYMPFVLCKTNNHLR